MQLDKRKQLILRAIPERKKTSKKLREKVLQEIYFRSSSLPQKKYTQSKQKQHSFTRRHQDLRGQPSQFSNKQRHSSQVKSSIQKIDQAQQFVPHRSIERKNRSLPKYLYSEPNNSQNESQFQLESFKNTDQYRTKVKKLSQKDDVLHQSQERHRLQTLQEILKKKNSQRLIRDNFLSNNMRNSPLSTKNPQKPKHKQSKMIGLKYSFENRKFTNLSKYKSSMGARNNPFSSTKLQYERQPFTNISRKVSKQNSKTKIKNTEEDNFYEEDNVKEDRDVSRVNEIEIKDLDLMEYIDSENVMKKDHNEKIVTLQDIFNQAYQHYQAYTRGKYDKPDKTDTKNSKQPKDKNLEASLKLLKTIQKQTGSLSRKTVLLLGLVSFNSNDFSNCIFYLQNVFREVNYNLHVIDSLKAWICPQEMIRFCSQIFIVLAESYKKTQNYLCSIKALDQWEKNIVQRYVKDYQKKQPKQAWINKKKRTVSQLSSYNNYQKERKFSKNDHFKHEYQSVTLEDELNPKKKSQSLLRQNSQGKMTRGYFSYTVKEKQRTQSLVKKDSIKFQTQHLNIKPRSKHLSIKTLSDINLNLNKETQNNILDEEQLKLLPQKYREIFGSGYLMRARIQFEIKNFYASIQDYQRTLACSQQRIQPGLELATLYYKIGRRDKCISFLEHFLDEFSQSTDLKSKKHESIRQIKYHLAVMLYKSAKYHESAQILQSMLKEDKSSGLEGQVSFYIALNMIKLKKVFEIGKELSEKEYNHAIEDILIKLQQSIDLGCSEFYIYAAYFIRIYLLLLKVKHYYGAQYEIDRMREAMERKKCGLGEKSLQNHSITQKQQKIDYSQISIQPFCHIVSLGDLMQLTSGIICILKLKLNKGLKLISQIQRKIRNSIKFMQSTNVISIEPHMSSDVSQIQNNMHANEILKLINEFKYYGLFTMRQYHKAVRCLEKIRIIDGINEDKSHNRLQTQLKDQEESQAQIPACLYETFKSDSDKLNFLNLQSLILIEQKKFHQALKMLKLIESQSSAKQKGHKRTKSGNLDTISTVIEYKKDQNMFYIIKALCYILLYKYLEDQKTDRSGKGLKDQTKIQGENESIHKQDDNDEQQPTSQNNEQILLVAQDLLSQCLICDKQNFQILYLIAVIHYQLCRYQSALNYIRQAIQLSDDHMIKHYYLKANMKLMLGKYDQAIKDYSNAITVYKEFQKDRREDARKEQRVDYRGQAACVEQTNGESTEIANPAYNIFNNNQSAMMTTRTQTSKEQTNEYYEQQQEMHLEIYLNRAIAYLKYAYSTQFETCRNIKLKMEEETVVKYSDIRENVVNLKATAAQDISFYFGEIIKQMKKQFHSLHNPKHPSNLSTISHNKSQSPVKPTVNMPSNNFTVEAFIQKAMKLAPFVQLLLHTSDVQPMLEISRSFVKEFDIKLISDEQLLVYFYIAKQLNNCLLLMEKIIKKHYLSQKNKRDSKPNHLKKQVTSKNQAQCQPYFKSKKDHKMQRSCNYPEFNFSKYTPQNTHLQRNENRSNYSTIQKVSSKQHQKIQKLIFDKKVLSALKDSSSNARQDYENALVTLLQENENIRKSNSDQNSYQGGTIFTYSDLVFFIGVLYYLLEDYQSAIKYFNSSYSIKKKLGQLYSLKSIIATALSPSYQDSSSSSDKWPGQKLQMSNLKTFDQIYDNRIYSKEQIEYNIGVAYLMAQDYNSAYDYLEKYEPFVEIIQSVLTQNESNLDDKKTKNKLRKIKKTLSDSDREDDLSFDDSVKTKTNKQDQSDTDVTPFPTHNRLCSIYPQKQINGKSFFLSFCLPKIDLPLLGLFSSEQIEIASLYIPSHQDKIYSKNDYGVKQSGQRLGRNKNPSKAQLSNKIFVNNTDKFLLKKECVPNFLDIVSLKDIEMKPIAPWIKKDKQKKCIRFTDNFLAESYDLKTQTTTERKHRNSSKKDMFGESSSRALNKRQKEKNEGKSERKQIPNNIEYDERQKINVAKLLKKSKAEQYNFMKQKQKQKTGQNRYETIQHD